MTDRDPLIHPTATVDDGAHIGAGTRVWHYSHVMPGASIGDRCTLGQNVYVGGKAVVGNQVKIQNNVSIYDGVVLEDEVFCGPSVVFTNVTKPRAFIDRKDALVPTRVARGATLGANSTVRCGCTIGAFAMVGAGATVTRDVAPHALMVGVPARQVGWVCRCGTTLDAGQAPDLLRCPECAARYRLVGGTLLPEIEGHQSSGCP